MRALEPYLYSSRVDPSNPLPQHSRRPLFGTILVKVDHHRHHPHSPPSPSPLPVRRLVVGIASGLLAVESKLRAVQRDHQPLSEPQPTNTRFVPLPAPPDHLSEQTCPNHFRVQFKFPFRPSHFSCKCLNSTQGFQATPTPTRPSRASCLHTAVKLKPCRCAVSSSKSAASSRPILEGWPLPPANGPSKQHRHHRPR